MDRLERQFYFKENRKQGQRSKMHSDAKYQITNRGKVHKCAPMTFVEAVMLAKKMGMLLQTQFHVEKIK